MFGFFGALFLFFGNKIQNYFSKKLNTQAGIDMKTAYTYSREKNLKISLIDMKLEKTIFYLSKISFKDKLKIFFKMIKCSFNKEYKNFLKNMNFLNVKKENVERILKLFRKDFPKLNKILLENRNKFMVQKILDVKEDNKKILVFVGAGHIYGMKKLLEEKIKSVSIFNFSFTLDEN